MTILDALKQLRDDLKLWCINNFNAKLNKNLGTKGANKLLSTDANGDIVTIDKLSNVYTKEEIDAKFAALPTYEEYNGEAVIS